MSFLSSFFEGLTRLPMSELFQFLIHHGYAVLFLWVLAEQVGAPVPAAPMLLAAGVLAGKGPSISPWLSFWLSRLL